MIVGMDRLKSWPSDNRRLHWAYLHYRLGLATVGNVSAMPVRTYRDLEENQ